jgi:four helix bundle protein
MFVGSPKHGVGSQNLSGYGYISELNFRIKKLLTLRDCSSTKSSSLQFKFEKLVIWKRAMRIGELMNGIADDFPEKEKFNLTSQLRRAADSIALNISEGSIGQSNKEYRIFIGHTIRSLAEVVTCLHKARNRNYISESDFKVYYSESFHTMNMLVSFKKT